MNDNDNPQEEIDMTKKTVHVFSKKGYQGTKEVERPPSKLNTGESRFGKKDDKI